MKPLFQTVLPETPVQILDADIVTRDGGHQLRLTLAMRSEIQKEVVLGRSLTDLIHQLVTRLGFSAPDAQSIVATAARRN